MRPSPRTKKMLRHKQLIKELSEELGVSEGAVRTVIHGFREKIIKELSEDRAVQWFGVGVFHTYERPLPKLNFKNVSPDICRRTSCVYPRFKLSIQFRNNIQALQGTPPAYFNNAKSMEEAMEIARKLKEE